MSTVVLYDVTHASLQALMNIRLQRSGNNRSRCRNHRWLIYGAVDFLHDMKSIAFPFLIYQRVLCKKQPTIWSQIRSGMNNYSALSPYHGTCSLYKYLNSPVSSPAGDRYGVLFVIANMTEILSL